MSSDRRQFIAAAGAGMALASLSPALAATRRAAATTRHRWEAEVRRCGQVNFSEIDPIAFDVEEWIDRWASMKVDCAVIGFGGVMATYPTGVPFHRRSQYLGHRDLTGEMVAAARRRGMRVIARIDPNYAYQDAVEAHPDWFMRHKDGSLRRMSEADYLFKLCQFGPFFSEQMPVILREMNRGYAPDGVFANGWPGTAAIETCYCVNCQKLYRERTGGVPPDTTDTRSATYRQFNAAYLERAVAIWTEWNAVLRERNPNAIFFGDLGGSGVQMIKDIEPIGRVTAMYAGDHQGRVGDQPIWDSAAQGRIARSVMDGKPVANLAAAYSYNVPRYRHTASPPVELELWLAQTTALGMVPWIHWLGGAVRDTRWEEPARRFFTWTAANDPHLKTRRSLADVAVLYPQSTIAFYRAEGKAERQLGGGVIDPADYFRGLYYALLDQRIPFDLVHQERLTPAALGRYKALLIPNAAFLRDEECAAIRAFAAAGGAVLATFETSRYNEWGEQRSDFGLQDLFGVTLAGDATGVVGPVDNSYMEIRQRHPVLAGFDGTDILPGPAYRVPVAAMPAGASPLTLIPHYVNAMPELIYPRRPRTDEPMAMFRAGKGGRVAYFAGDVDRMAWTNGNPDFCRLIGDAVRWLLADQSPAVDLKGPGLVEVVPWESDAGLAIHLVNYTTPNALRPFVHEVVPVGPMTLTVDLPAGQSVRRVQALYQPRELPFRIEGRRLTVDLDRLGTYEVVAVT